MAFLIQKVKFKIMPQITVNSTNIETFGFSALFDPYAQSILFDTASLTTYNNESGTGFLYVLGVCFSVIDQDGVVLASVDWDNPQINPAASETEYTLDLSSVGIDFFFQTYSIIGYIKDGDGTVYQTTQVNPTICQPVGINSSGAVDGVFQVTANCPDNVLTVKEVTKLVYNNLQPTGTVKDGTLTYPSGTISSLAFTGTPFTNDVIYTGQYRINCETVSTYDLGNDIYVAVTYLTNNVFDVTCSNKLQDILCCVVDLQRTQLQNCNNAVGERAQQLEAQITIPFLLALSKEMAGQDASTEVALIKKTLNCKCGGQSIIQNEFTPINPSVTTIVLQGVGGTSIAAPTINGNTKTYNIQSNIYQVVKSNTLDTAFSITLNTSTPNTVKYLIAFNYQILAGTILTQIGNDSGLLTQFNSLVNISNFSVDLTNLNGGCIIDLSSTSYFLSLRVASGASTIVSVLINGTTYTALSPITVNDPDGIELWLNGLGLGTFTAGFSLGTTGAYINILTTGNANVITSAVFNIGALTTVLFQKTNKSIVAFLQAVVDYICALSDLQVALSNPITICYVDYNGTTVTTTYPALTTSQATFNEQIAYALCQSVARINTQFVNGLTKVDDIVKLGGQLTGDTVIQALNYSLSLQTNGSAFTFTSSSLTGLMLDGTSPSSKVSVIYQTADGITLETETYGDRAAVSYYAESTLITRGTAIEAILGAYYPATNDPMIPAPALDPDRSAYVNPFDGGIEFYGKTQTHTGSSSNFDTLLRFKVMTTAERDAIDVSLLTAGVTIFNSDVTTPGKLQCYNGSSWQNLW
jgi:hypothetical protein